MSLPSAGGQYGPYGENEGPSERGSGWNDRLRLHYLAQSSEEQRRLYDYACEHPEDGAAGYAYYVSGKLISEVGTRVNVHPENPPFTPLLDHEPPRFFKTEKGFDTLSSIISLNNRVLAVDETIKAIVERLEPGVHQFFPNEIQMPRGKVYPVRYFTLVVGQYIDSLVPEKCKEGALRPNGPHKYFSADSKKALSGRAFSRARFGTAHLWRERAFGEWLTCFSDALQDEIRKMNLLMPKHYRMIEV